MPEFRTTNERFLQDVFDAIQDGISVLDCDLNIVQVNAWMQRMYAHNAPLEGRKCFQVYQQRSSPCPWCPTLKAIGEGETRTVEVPYPSEDDVRGWIELTAFPMKDDLGKVTGIIEYVKDISDRRRAEQELGSYREHLEDLVQQRTAELRAANQELESFAYSVSHDLRSPLRSMSGFSQAVLEDCGDYLDATCVAHLKRIQAAAAKMAALIDELLKLSRVTRSRLAWREVDLSRMATDILGGFRQQEPARRVEVSIAPDLRAHCDPGLLEIALRNMLNNAWKFTAGTPDARIAFDAHEEGSDLVFCVRDNGAGFDMAYADKLFGVFQRLHHAEEFGGNGIGLATVQRIISRHRGRIWARAEPGKGAEFFFTLAGAAGPAVAEPDGQVHPRSGA